MSLKSRPKSRDAESPPPVEEQVNPFKNTFEWTPGRIAGLIFFHLTGLFIVRFLLIFVVGLLGLLFIPWLFSLGHQFEKNGAANYYSPRRSWWISNSFMVTARISLFLMGYWVKVEGEWDPDTRIVVSTHATALDTLFILAAGMPVSPYVANYLLDMGIIGRILKLMLAEPVNRAATGIGAGLSDELLRRAEDPKFPRTLVFPEGTNTNSKAVISFKTGSFRTGYPVQPVVLNLSRDYNAWVPDGPGLFFLFWLYTWQFGLICRVQILPTVGSSKSPLSSYSPVLEQAQVCRSAMARRLGVPMTSHTVEDGLLLGFALRHFKERLELPLWKTLKSERKVQFRQVRKVLYQLFAGDRSEMTKNDKDEWIVLDYLLRPKVAPLLWEPELEESIGKKS